MAEPSIFTLISNACCSCIGGSITMAFGVWMNSVGRSIVNSPGVADHPECKLLTLGTWTMNYGIVAIVLASVHFASLCCTVFSAIYLPVGACMVSLLSCSVAILGISEFVFWIGMNSYGWSGCHTAGIALQWWGEIRAFLIATYVLNGLVILAVVLFIGAFVLLIFCCVVGKVVGDTIAEPTTQGADGDGEDEPDRPTLETGDVDLDFQTYNRDVITDGGGSLKDKEGKEKKGE